MRGDPLLRVDPLAHIAVGAIVIDTYLKELERYSKGYTGLEEDLENAYKMFGMKLGVYLRRRPNQKKDRKEQ